MIAILLTLVYAVIAFASGVALLVGAVKHAGHDWECDFSFGWILCGMFWPVCLVPACAYIAARYYISKMETRVWKG